MGAVNPDGVVAPASQMDQRLIGMCRPALAQVELDGERLIVAGLVARDDKIDGEAADDA